MKRTREETNQATLPAPQKSYITLAKECLASGNLALAMQYLHQAEEEISVLRSQLSHLYQQPAMHTQHTMMQSQIPVPPRSALTEIQQPQATTQSSTVTAGTDIAFNNALDTSMGAFLTFIKQKEYSEPYSKLHDDPLVEAASKNLILFMQGKNAVQLRLIVDKLCELTQNLTLSGIAHTHTMTKNHYILKHLQWAAYFHLVQNLLSIDLTLRVAKLAELPPGGSLASQDYNFSYRKSYIELMQYYLSADKFSLKHPFLLEKICTKQDRYNLQVFLCFKRLIDDKNESEIHILSYVENAYQQLFLAQLIKNGGKCSAPLPDSACTSLESRINNAHTNSFVTLSLRSLYTILSDEVSRKINADLADITHFTNALNAQGSIAALFLDAMARIAKQAGDLVNAKQYAISALERCKEHNIELRPEYKLHAIAQIKLPDATTNNAPNHPEVDDLGNFAFNNNALEEVWVDTTASSAYSLTQVPMTPHVTNTPDINALQHTHDANTKEFDPNSFFS